MDVSTRYRILIADDHPLFRDALRYALADTVGAVDIVEAGTIEEVADRIEGDQSRYFCVKSVNGQ